MTVSHQRRAKQNRYNRICHRLLTRISCQLGEEEALRILDTGELSDLFQSVPGSLSIEEQRDRLRAGIRAMAYAQQGASATPVCLPSDPRVPVLGFDIDKVSAAVSSTAPLIVPVIALANPEPGSYSSTAWSGETDADSRPILVAPSMPPVDAKLELYQLMYKREDIRKDQVILNAIRLMDLILRKHGMDLHILTYRVIPTGTDCGFLEMIQGARTLYSIQKPKDPKESNDVPTLSQYFQQRPQAIDRFQETLAAWCIITLLLGVGDRHMNNIMARPDGTLFHIDYGYVLGQG